MARNALCARNPFGVPRTHHHFSNPPAATRRNGCASCSGLRPKTQANRRRHSTALHQNNGSRESHHQSPGEESWTDHERVHAKDRTQQANRFEGGPKGFGRARTTWWTSEVPAHEDQGSSG